MISLKDYTTLERLARSSPDLGCAIDQLFDLYQEKKRLSGRLVIQHCLETGEITSHYTADPEYLVTAIYHDFLEDLPLSFGSMKLISGVYRKKVAGMVTILSKRADLKNKNDRNREYMARIAKAIEGNPWVGVIKIADRMSNLTDIQSLPADKRRRIASQTLNFYVPIALRLGLVGLAKSLQELSLPHSLPYSGGRAGDSGITERI